jgi:hypothetical protein
LTVLWLEVSNLFSFRYTIIQRSEKITFIDLFFYASVVSHLHNCYYTRDYWPALRQVTRLFLAKSHLRATKTMSPCVPARLPQQPTQSEFPSDWQITRK